MPAPGQYGSSSLDVPSGGKFNTSNTKSDIEWAILRASKVGICGTADFFRYPTVHVIRGCKVSLTCPYF